MSIARRRRSKTVPKTASWLATTDLLAEREFLGAHSRRPKPAGYRP